MDRALSALDHVFPTPQTLDRPSWTFGGGTALAIWLAHRTSYDIDIFLADSTLRAFTPAHNPAAAAISSKYRWPGHYLKFECPEGEIDFLRVDRQTDPGFAPVTYNGRAIAIETPDEILVKKIRYRATGFKARDAFDLAATHLTLPGIPKTLATYVPDRLDDLADALDHLHNLGPEHLKASVNPSDRFEHLPNIAIATCQEIVSEAAKIARQISRQASASIKPVRPSREI